MVTAARDMEHLDFDDSVLHITYPLLDGKQEQIASFFEKFYWLVESNITNGSLLVHCAAGISRVMCQRGRAPPLSAAMS